MYKTKLDSTIELSFQSQSLLESTASFHLPKRDLNSELTESVANTGITKLSIFDLLIFKYIKMFQILVQLLQTGEKNGNCFV